jgi:hypothetical protein
MTRLRLLPRIISQSNGQHLPAAESRWTKSARAGQVDRKKTGVATWTRPRSNGWQCGVRCSHPSHPGDMRFICFWRTRSQLAAAIRLRACWTVSSNLHARPQSALGPSMLVAVPPAKPCASPAPLHVKLSTGRQIAIHTPLASAVFLHHCKAIYLLTASCLTPSLRCLPTWVPGCPTDVSRLPF